MGLLPLGNRSGTCVFLYIVYLHLLIGFNIYWHIMCSSLWWSPKYHYHLQLEGWSWGHSPWCFSCLQVPFGNEDLSFAPREATLTIPVGSICLVSGFGPCSCSHPTKWLDFDILRESETQTSEHCKLFYSINLCFLFDQFYHLTSIQLEEATAARTAISSTAFFSFRP